MKLFIYIFLVYIVSYNLYAKQIIKKWNITVSVLDEIKLKDGSEFRINNAQGSWEDDQGFFGFLKCIGPIFINNKNNLDLNLICQGYDNNGDSFELNLKRNSIQDAGIGKAIYISGEGRYKDFVNKKCTYAVRYLNNEFGFYRQVCKD